MVTKTRSKPLFISIIAVVISLLKDVECCSSVSDTGEQRGPDQPISNTSKFVSKASK